MDQASAPIVEALAALERHPVIGFGAPAHHGGAAMPTNMRGLIGRQVFRADLLSPKGLDDRTESGHVFQRAHEIAAEAWNAEFCRFATGGSTESLHIAIASVAGPGDAILLAANVHKAERAHALAVGLDAAIVPVAIDPAWDIEHGVTPEAARAAFAAHPAAKALVVVSPSYYGVAGDIAALADVCHEHGVPLIVDAAWGGAFAFSERLPPDPLAKGADIAVYSAHKTMGALAQGSILVARGGRVDLQHLAMAYELFQTTSPAIPILATLDATRRDHALHGPRLWDGVLDLAADLRRRLAAIAGLRLFGADDLPDGAALDESKVLIDVSALGVAGYAIDDWLQREHRVSVGLSDARHLLVIVALGTRRSDIRALARALRDLVARLARDPALLPPAPPQPSIATLSVEMAMPGAAAFFAPAETVRYEDAAGRIAAETIAPAPPGVPRLVPGQRITAAHVAWLVAARDAGAFVIDPVDPMEKAIRVVREAPSAR